MGPAQRRRVALDVAAAVDHLAAVEGVDSSRLGLLVEQDTAADALEAVADDARVAALAVLSARHPARTRAAVERRRAPVYGLVSIEDREGLRATVDAYLAAPPRRQPARRLPRTGSRASRWRPCSSSSGRPSSNSTPA